MCIRDSWYIDLASPTNGALGERMIGEHKHFGEVLLATSMVPDPNECKPGGSGYINAIDPFTGASVTNLFFDINNDLKFSDLDRLGVQKRAIGSFDPGINLPSDVVLLSNPGSPAGGPNAAIFASGTSGQTAGGATGLPYRTGRISWRELVTP